MKTLFSVIISMLLLCTTTFAAPAAKPYGQVTPAKVVKAKPIPTPAPVKYVTQMVKNPKTGKMEMVTIVKK